MSMKKYIFLTICAALAIAFPGCRKDAPELLNPNNGAQLLRTPSQIFESFWHGMNNSYAFWAIDPTDWDAVYDEYLPRFRALDGQKTVPTAKLEELYTELSKDLIDHHLAITITNNRAAEGDKETFMCSPSDAEIRSRPYYHEPMTLTALQAPILKNMAAGRISNIRDASVFVDDGSLYVCSYRIDGVIYIYINSFMLSPALRENPEGDVAQVLENYHRMLLETPDVKGVIVDVRNNGGGAIADMQLIIAPMLGADLLAGHSRSKSGPGRLDYGPWIPAVIAPAEEHRRIDAPIVVLADLYSVSMAEMTAMAVSALPNGSVIGERTCGGNGPLFGDYEFSYGGAFKNECVDVYTSTSLMRDSEGVIHEGVGVTPDIEVLYDEESMLAGTDKQLERALKFISTGN